MLIIYEELLKLIIDAYENCCYLLFKMSNLIHQSDLLSKSPNIFPVIFSAYTVYVLYIQLCICTYAH